MKARFWLVTLFLIPVLLLAACSGTSLALDAPGLSAQPAAAAQVATPEAGSASETGITPEAISASEALEALQSIFVQIYEKVNPSVVNIQIVATRATSFGSQEGGSGLGSGFVWDQQGHIVTNAHVVEGAGEISVTFADGSTVAAELVGSDRYSDLAVIKVELPADRLQPVEMADSRQVKVGQLAIAIGNPFGLQGTMTQGIVSGLSRSLSVDVGDAFSQQGGRYSIPDIIQTDASINPGNSGGVLVDDQGKVIGVTSAIASSTQSNSGVGFVIPSAIVQNVVPSLIDAGSVSHSWMGISGGNLTPELAQAANLAEDQQGVLVLGVTPGGPAEQAGLRGSDQVASGDGQEMTVDGDIIIGIDGQTVQRFDDLVSYLYNNTIVGQTVTLTILRQGQQQTIELTLGALPNPS